MQQEKETPRAGGLYENSTVINVSKTGRIVSSAAGASLVYIGLADIGKNPVKSLFRILAGSYLLYRGVSGNCPVSAMIEDARPKHARAINIRTSFIVNRPRAEVYSYWRKLENLPSFMAHLHDVDVQDERFSHWTIRLAGNIKLEWDAEIVEDEPNEMLGWRSLEGAQLANAGKIRFRDAENGGTELLVTITYRPPAGYVGEGIARLFNPAFENLVRNDVKGFKQYLEEKTQGFGNIAVG